MSNENYHAHAANLYYHGYGAGQMPGIPQGAHVYTGVPGQGGVGMPGVAGYGAAAGPQYAQGAYPYAPQQPAPSSSFTNDRFLKGLLIGATATYLITNESVQKTAIKSVVRAWTHIQGGVEEMKERFHDAEAEIQAAESTEK